MRKRIYKLHGNKVDGEAAVSNRKGSKRKDSPANRRRFTRMDLEQKWLAMWQFWGGVMLQICGGRLRICGLQLWATCDARTYARPLALGGLGSRGELSFES